MGCRLALLALVCSTSLTFPAHRTVLAAGNDGMTVLGRVTAVPASGLILRQANFFDLEDRTVTFTPDGTGGYAVRVGALTWVETSAAARSVYFEGRSPEDVFEDGFRPRFRRAREGDVGTDLGFGFPFAGRIWAQVHANADGNVSFRAPETTHWEERNPWPDGGMNSVASAVDSRSAAGLEAMIAVLWGAYEAATITVDSAPERVAVTWNAVRSEAHEQAGENVFQVRLYPSGVVEMAYRRVPERDGIVGLFHGGEARGNTLGAVEDEAGDVSDPILDIVSAELVDNGSTFIASVKMAGDIPTSASTTTRYRFSMHYGEARYSCVAGLRVRESGREPYTWSRCGADPTVVGYRVRGDTLEFPISKTLIKASSFSWHWTVYRGDERDGTSTAESVTLPDSDRDLSAARTVAGNVFEVFHYPLIPKRTEEITPHIYEHAPAEDEFAVPLTDFRVDDLFNVGHGSGPINVVVQGIGRDRADPGEDHGSDVLLSTHDPVFVGAPRYGESGAIGRRPFRGYAFAVWFIAHELVHRWAAHLQFRDPVSGRIEPLTKDSSCECHWSRWLHAPAVHPVWQDYSDEPYPDASVMGGRVWVDNGDGTFSLEDGSGRTVGRATGLSALDLYVMGMIPPEDVEPTFMLLDAVETGTRGRFTATKVPVRIEDVVAAMGPREPPASKQRRVFRLGVYLLHEDGRAPRADHLARSRGIKDALVRYFARATGGDLDPARRRPVVTERLPDRSLKPGGILEVDLSQAFTDPDGDRLTYGVSSSAPDVVRVFAADARLTLSAVSAGTATIRVTATDPGGLSTDQTFRVRVSLRELFTDDPIVPGMTPIRAVHFTELRSRIHALRQAADLPRFTWTDPVLTTGVTRVRLAHLLELRSALTQAYAAAGRPAPRWTDATPPPGPMSIRAAHLMELRAAVRALE